MYRRGRRRPDWDPLATVSVYGTHSTLIFSLNVRNSSSSSSSSVWEGWKGFTVIIVGRIKPRTRRAYRAHQNPFGSEMSRTDGLLLHIASLVVHFRLFRWEICVRGTNSNRFICIRLFFLNSRTKKKKKSNVLTNNSIQHFCVHTSPEWTPVRRVNPEISSWSAERLKAIEKNALREHPLGARKKKSILIFSKCANHLDKRRKKNNIRANYHTNRKQRRRNDCVSIYRARD